jgi:hypothetical protein
VRCEVGNVGKVGEVGEVGEVEMGWKVSEVGKVRWVR